MIALGSDHAGFDLKQEIIAYLKEKGLEYKDFGTFSRESCDYPDFGEAAARAVVSGECERGILICGTGIGISMAANKVRGIRCASCSDCFSAEMARLHNNANMLAFGARVVGGGLALKLVEIFLNTEFEGGRHGRRVGKIMAIEDR
ncbi:MAG: ribose 5-phosphate isomerase B [Clostridiales bacterium]|jgi:ribose 5-phosphate isomerase B|nr:ribose 5-phosphate isomerase B [Clostridiales bacterium]